MLFENTDKVPSVGSDHPQVGIIYQRYIRQYDGFRELSGQVVQRESPQHLPAYRLGARSGQVGLGQPAPAYRAPNPVY